MSMGWTSTAATGSFYYHAHHVHCRLKSLLTLIEEFNFEKRELTGELEDLVNNWLISDEMAPKFGDDNYYDFEPADEASSYTHRLDGYYYHESWFIDEHEENAPIIKLEDEDFLL